MSQNFEFLQIAADGGTNVFIIPSGTAQFSRRPESPLKAELKNVHLKGG